MDDRGREITKPVLRPPPPPGPAAAWGATMSAAGLWALSALTVDAWAQGPHGESSCLWVTNCPPAHCDSSQGCYTFLRSRAAQADESRKWKSSVRALGKLAVPWREVITTQACKFWHVLKFFCNCAFFTMTAGRNQTPWLFLLGNTFFYRLLIADSFLLPRGT